MVAEYQAAGLPIEYIHRTHRHGYKAGALQNGLETATGEIVAIFDADFIPPVDFLRRTVDFFADPKVGMVQTRWGYLNRHYNLLTEVQAMLLDGHFVLEHVARSGGGRFFNFNGTAGILRRSMIDDAGGWQHDTLTEDSDLSYRAQLKGWKFVYVPSIECLSELPVETYGFQVQQSRWAKGLTQVAMKLLPTILRSDAPRQVKIEAFFHLTPNISYPLMIVVSALMLPVMIVRFYMGWFQMLTIDLPLIIASFWSISAFYVVAHREIFPKTWKRAFLFLPALMAAGVALTVINTRSVLEALCGYQTGFARTPKYAIGGTQKVKLENIQYRRRSGWLPYAELARRHLLPGDGGVRDRILQLPGNAVSDCCSSAGITGLVSARCGKSTRANSHGRSSRNWLPRLSPQKPLSPIHAEFSSVASQKSIHRLA